MSEERPARGAEPWNAALTKPLSATFLASGSGTAMSSSTNPRIAVVLSGGAALGAYQAGAYARLHDGHGGHLAWIAGSSVGAVNGAIIAGNEPQRRVPQLTAFWQEASALPTTQPLAEVPWLPRRTTSWLGVLRARTAGSGFFRPRLLPELLSPWALSFYDLAPLQAKLPRFVDFDLLNRGPSQGSVRLSVVTADVATGESVIFDTGAGDRIEPAHLLASSGLLPDFQPTEVDGRLLGDGSLVEHAPARVVLGEPRDEPLLCFLIDAFARIGARPTTMERAAERRLDLMMTSQTRQVLDGLSREHLLRQQLSAVLDRLPASRRRHPELVAAAAEARSAGATVLHLAYRAGPQEARPEKQFDFSAATLADRWAAGEGDMQQALDQLEIAAEDGRDGFTIHRIGYAA